MKEAVLAGTAVEAVRSVFSSNEGAEFAELLVQQLGVREPSIIDDAAEVARLQRKVKRLEQDLAAMDAAKERLERDAEWLGEGRSLAYEQLLSDLEVPSSVSGSGEVITFPHFAEQLEMWHAASKRKVEWAEASVAKVTELAAEVSEKYAKMQAEHRVLLASYGT